MEVRLLGHASLWIQHAGASLLVDPWLTGTCYDQGWALLPPRPDATAGLTRPDAVTFSHAHADHFHMPSLVALRDRFGADLPMLVPRQAVDVMSGALRRLGFTDIRDVPLGAPYALAPGLSMRVHACRADDAVQIISAGDRTIVNANDCRLEGRLLAHLRRLAPAPDFYFGQFSLADGYPYCFEGLDPADLAAAVEEPLTQFVSQASAFGARWSVPSASFVRFAHEENTWLNRLALTMDDVARAFQGSLAIWYPGDGWSEEHGFLSDPAHRAAWDAARRAALAGDGVAVTDPPPPVDELRATVDRRFADMMAVIPAWLRRRMRPVGFVVRDLDVTVVADWARGTWAWSAATPAAAHYRVSAAHFQRVCHTDWGWSTLHIAGRFSVRGWTQSDAVSMFMPVSTLYALRYFHQPWRHYLTPRVLGVTWARRQEIADLALRTLRRAAWSDAPVPRL